MLITRIVFRARYLRKCQKERNLKAYFELRDYLVESYRADDEISYTNAETTTFSQLPGKKLIV